MHVSMVLWCKMKVWYIWIKLSLVCFTRSGLSQWLCSLMVFKSFKIHSQDKSTSHYSKLLNLWVMVQKYFFLFYYQLMISHILSNMRRVLHWICCFSAFVLGRCSRLSVFFIFLLNNIELNTFRFQISYFQDIVLRLWTIKLFQLNYTFFTIKLGITKYELFISCFFFISALLHGSDRSFVWGI